jgi:hypothetical protein
VVHKVCSWLTVVVDYITKLEVKRFREFFLDSLADFGKPHSAEPPM